MSNDPIVIVLNWCDVTAIAGVGVMRHVRALRRGLHDMYGADERDGWGMHIEGAAGEYVTARAVRRYWPGVGDVGGEDVDGLQVRTTSIPHGQLVVYPRDRDDVPFVSVVGKIPRFEIYGWYYGRDAKRDEWLTDFNGRYKHPVYAVPRDVLLPLRALPIPLVTS